MNIKTKIFVCVLFTSFNLFLIAPSLIILANSEVDTSMFYSVEEEEETQGVKQEKLFKSELFCSTDFKFSSDIQTILTDLNLNRKYYYDPYLAVLVPPPKQHI